jgi:response regulator RpfG family c-di-GMP phosphodiesterase
VGIASEWIHRSTDIIGLVISDLRMPEMNGYEFVKRVKEIKPGVQIFLLTAFEIDRDEFKNLFQSVKIEEFIQKPISFKRLAEKIRKYIEIQIEA